MRLFVKKTARGRMIYRYFLLCAAVFLFLFIGVRVGDAAFNPQINYQGKLTDSSGTAVTDGSYNMHFRLCADSSCSSVLMNETWVDSNKVTVTDGLFSVMLGAVSSTLDTINFNQDIYLEVSVGGTSTPSWETLLPRKRLGSVPNAFNADKVDGFNASSTATANYIPVLDSNAGLTVSGVTSTANLYVGGNATATGIFYGGSGSYFGDTLGNYWKTDIWDSPVGNIAMLRGSSFEGSIDIGGIWNGLYVLSEIGDPGVAFIDKDNFDLSVAISYDTSSDYMLFVNAATYSFDGPIYSVTDTPFIYFSDTDGTVNSRISFATNTDAMSFADASGGYLFDGKVGVSSTTPSHELSVSGVIYSDDLFATSTGNYLTYFQTSKQVYNSYLGGEVVVGASGIATTTDQTGSYAAIGLYGEGQTGILAVTNATSSGKGISALNNSADGIAGYFFDQSSSTESHGLVVSSTAGIGALITAGGTSSLMVSNTNSNNYSIYSTGGLNYFQSNVGIATATPSEKLSLSGGSVYATRTYTSSTFNYLTTFKSGANTLDSLGSGSLELAIGVLGQATSSDFSHSGGIIDAGVLGSGYYGLIGYSNTGSAGLLKAEGSAAGLTVQTGDGYGATISTTNGARALSVSNSSSTQYALYSSAGLNYLSGLVGMGSATPISGYALSVGGNAYFNGNVTTTGDLAVGSGITLGGVRRTSWPNGGGSGAFWTTSTNSLVGSPTLGPGHAIVVGDSSYPAATSSNVSFEVVGSAKVGGKLEVTATSTLATTSMAFNSWIGNTTNNLQFEEYSFSDTIFNGSNLNFIDSQNGVSGIGVRNNIGIISSGADNPIIFMGADNTSNLGMFIYTTSTNNLTLQVFNSSGDSIGYDSMDFGTDILTVTSDNDPAIRFLNGGANDIIVRYDTSTDALNFTNASGGYSFDNNVSTTGDLLVATGKGITLGGVYRTSWPAGGSGTAGFWETSTNSLIGYPVLDSGYAIVIGSNVTSSDNVKLEVVGNTKLSGNAEITGNATTSGIMSIGTLRVNSESFTDLTGLGLTNDGGTLRVATTSLGLLTTNVSEGTNLYWTDARFDARLAATTSLPNLASLAGLTTIGSASVTTTMAGNLSVSGTSSLGTIISGTWSGSVIGVSKGGTGTTTLTTNGILYGNGTSAVQVTAAGTNNYLLYSNNGTPAWTNAPTISGANITSLSASNISAGTLSVSRGGTGLNALTSGYIPFGNGTSAFNTSSNFYWNNSTGRLSLGAGTSPGGRLEIRDTGGAQLRASYNSSIYLDLTVGSDDKATFDITGSSGVNPDLFVFRDQIGAPDGTVSAPGITFYNDTNSGFYEAANDDIALTTGGSERLRVTNNYGYLLVGTTTETSKVTVYDDSSSAPYGLYVNKSGGLGTYAGYFYNKSGDGIYSDGYLYGIHGYGDVAGLAGYGGSVGVYGSGVTGVSAYGTNYGVYANITSSTAAAAVYARNEYDNGIGLYSVADYNYFSGYLGLNTSTPSAYLNIFNNSTSTDFIRLASSTNNNILVVDGSGNMAIGTTTDSSYKLKINGGFSVADGSTNWGFLKYSEGMAFTATAGTLYLRPYNGGDVQIFNDLKSGSYTKKLKIYGSVGVGTSNPQAMLHVVSSSASIYIDASANTNPSLELREDNVRKWHLYNDNSTDRLYVVDKDDNNGVYLAQDATSWTANSDIRLKENISPISNALQKVLALSAYTYNFKGNSNTEIGLIAQEVEPYFPELVDTSSEYWGIRYDRIGAIMVNAIKQQQEQIDNLSVQMSSSSQAGLVVGANDPQFNTLRVSSAATFYGAITVVGETGFEAKVVFKDHVYSDKDSAGVAKILAGATSTVVSFSKPYEVTPIINLTPKSNLTGISLWVENEATSSFTIAISQAVDREIEINWQAVAVWNSDNGVQSDIEIIEISPADPSVAPVNEATDSSTASTTETGVIIPAATAPATDVGDTSTTIDNSASDGNIDNSHEDNETADTPAASEPTIGNATDANSVTETPTASESPVTAPAGEAPAATAN